MSILYHIKIMWYNMILRYELKNKPYLDEIEDYSDTTEVLRNYQLKKH